MQFASPPLVLAYALAGTVDIDFEKVEWERMVRMSISRISGRVPKKLQRLFNPVYCLICSRVLMKLSQRLIPCGIKYQSQHPSCTHGTQVLLTFMSRHISMTMDPPGPHGVKDAYCLLNFGDSITTDHISPAGSIHKDSPAAKFLLERGIYRKDLNSYGNWRCNDEIMAR